MKVNKKIYKVLDVKSKLNSNFTINLFLIHIVDNILLLYFF
jgi:hypothetical protein